MVVQRTQSGPTAQSLPRTEGAGGGTYTVQRGDTMSGIAARNSMSLDALKAANPQVRNSSLIFPGDKLNLSGGDGSRYTVQRGDSFSAIAAKHGASVAALQAANPDIRNINRIYPGETLNIPVRGSGGGTGAAPVGAALTATAPAGVNIPATSAIANLRAMFDPAKGSNALAAIIIGNAEGTRTPSGGTTRAYAGHIDPGNGAGNRGSFSYQHTTPGMTAAQADVAQLRRLNGQIPAFEAAAQRAGIDPNNVTVATAYFDLYNQSPLAAGRFLKQMGYLKDAGISTQSVTELRFRSYVDVSTGERFKIRASNGTMVPGAGGFANIARKNLERQGINRAPTEAEIHQTIRADQNRRMRAMNTAIAAVGSGGGSNDAGVATVPPAQQSPPNATSVTPAASQLATANVRQTFTANSGLDLSPAVVRSASALHDAVAAATGYRLHITSGRRGPDRQAAAMYDNWASNSAPSYRNKVAEREIKAAYLDGRNRGLSRSQTIANMTNVIANQVDRGVLISKHLSSKAIDIRTPPVAVRQAVLNAIRENPAVQSVGIENDHYHIQFR